MTDRLRHRSCLDVIARCLAVAEGKSCFASELLSRRDLFREDYDHGDG